LRPLSRLASRIEMRVAKVIIGDIDNLTGGYLYEKKLVEYLRQQGHQADIVSIPNLPYALQFLANLWLPLHFLAKKYDVIIEDEMAHNAVCLFNLWARYVTRTKVVAIVHMFSWIAAGGNRLRPLVRFIEKTMLGSADLVIANSRHTREAAEKMGLPADAIVVVYPGLDMDLAREATPKHGDTIRLLFVGNWDPRKGLDTLIEAVSLLDNPEIVLDIVGEDSFHPRYAKRVRRSVAVSGMENSVRFHGRVDRESIARFYSEADVFVLPSSYEPFGIVFAEAMSFGLPIVAADAGGIPELVEHEDNGLLVPPNDATALAAAIDRLASSADLRERLGRRGCEKSKGLNTWDDCFEIVHGHLKRLLREPT